MYILGIDPGANGAIALATYNSEMGAIYQYYKMPSGPAGLHELFVEHIDPICGPGYAYVEKVGGFNPRSEPHLVTANLKLREHLGEINACLICHGVSIQKVVTANTWQNFVAPGMPSGRDSAAKRKSDVYEAVLAKVPHNRCAFVAKGERIPKYAADAFGILLYGMHHCPDWRA